MNKRKTYTGHLNKLESNQIFVFGSNPEGRHGKGAALIAKKTFGAQQGQGKGIMGQSYGIITKDLRIKKNPSIPTKKIKSDIRELYLFAIDNPQMEFFIAYGVNIKLLSGFSIQQMANMFYNANKGEIPVNIIFEQSFDQLVYGSSIESLF
jgi:hypothetical protein